MCPKCEKPSKSQFPLLIVLMLYLSFAFLHLIFGNKFQLLCLSRSVINRPAMYTLKCMHTTKYFGPFTCTPAKWHIFCINVLVGGIIRMHSKCPKLPRSGLLLGWGLDRVEFGHNKELKEVHKGRYIPRLYFVRAWCRLNKMSLKLCNNTYLNVNINLWGSLF